MKAIDDFLLLIDQAQKDTQDLMPIQKNPRGSNR